jgi:hypothetical protein
MRRLEVSPEAELEIFEAALRSEREASLGHHDSPEASSLFALLRFSSCLRRASICSAWMSS